MTEFNKELYWKRRKENKRGQGEVATIRNISPTDVEVAFGNDGKMIIKNRETRRRRIKQINANVYTRKTMNKAERKDFRKKGRK